MGQQYDVSFKELFRRSNGLVMQRLFGGPIVEWVDVEQPKVTNIRADLVARLADGRLRHVEIQAKNEADMGRRQAEYYLGFLRLLGEEVEQVLLYVGREPLRMPAVFETRRMRFEFEILDIRELDGEPLLESDDWGDNVLALLTRVDQERVLAKVEAQLRRLKGEEQAIAANAAVIISGIIGMEESLGKRLSMIDIMENKVLGPAIRRGIAQGIVQGEATSLKIVLAERFGELHPNTLARIDAASQEVLTGWLKRALSAKSIDEVFGA